MKHLRIAGLVVFGWLASRSSQGQGVNSFTLTDGAAIFTLRNITVPGPGGSGRASFMVGGKDHMYQNWWWYNDNSLSSGNSRLGGQKKFQRIGPQEVRLTYSIIREYRGGRDGLYNTITLVFDYKLTEISAKRARVDVDFTITSNRFRDVVINLFNYNDAEIDGTASGDEADITRTNTRQLIWEDDMAGVRLGEMRYTAGGADFTSRSWEIAAYPGLRDKLDKKGEDNRVNALANSGAPFGPGDYTGGFHWRGRLPSNAATTLTGWMSLDVKIP